MLLDPRYKDMVIDDSTKTQAINSIIVSAIAIQNTTQLQPVPIKSETDAVPEALPQLPTLPTALIEQDVVPKMKTNLMLKYLQRNSKLNQLLRTHS